MSSGSFDASGRPDECPDDHAPPTLRDRTLPLSHMPSGVRKTSALIWLGFILFPLVDAIGEHGSVLQRALIIAGAALFVAAYVTMILTWQFQHPTTRTLLLFVVMLGLATALTVLQSPGWGFLFTYCAACSALVARKHLGFYAVATCAVLAGVTSAIGGANGGDVIAFVASTAGVGMLMVVLGDLRVRNEELSAARAELAELAVAQERERFARDLHDLLGHSLSVITLKAELAGRMLNDRPVDAAREISELEQVARTALGEVREAASGYRQPTLDRELAGARMALSAAGIEADIHQAHVPLDPPVEAVLAWAVREGATNVIRHSGARHCKLQVTASLTDAGVEVIDDGVGNDDGTTNGGGSRGSLVGSEPQVSNGTANRPFAGATSGGHGLDGLAERARLVNGKLEAGALADGGYRLAVIVPVAHS